MNESVYKRKLVAEINLMPRAYAVRIEDRFAVGRLDLIIKLPDKPVIWVEGKIVDGYQFEPTMRQYEEGLLIEAAGMMALLIGWKSGVMHISPWVEKADARSCFTAEKLSYAKTLVSYLEQQ